MTDTIQKPAPSIDLAPTASLLGGSPKGMYVYFLLALCRNYFETAVNGADADTLERATGALIAFCPSTQERLRIWKFYIDKKNESGSNQYTASVLSIGELISYLSLVLEFEETSTGGVM
jgi:hypothetical protein